MTIPETGSLVLTGANGFLGSRILKLLERDPQYRHIVVVDKKKPTSHAKKARYYRLDLTEPVADVKLAEILKQERCDTFVHCAMPITPPKNQSYSHELISVGTMYAMNACAEARVRKFILLSTTDVYGAFASNPNFLLEDVHEPQGRLQSHFLADKIDAEKQALRYAKKYPDRVVTILRPCSIFGPSVQSYKTRYLERVFVATVLGFDPLIQFIHEDDLDRAINIAIDKDFPGIFNIVGDGVLPLSRVIKICNKLHIRLPQLGFKSLVQLLWYLDFAPAPATHVDFLRYLCVADGTKASELMGFTPKFTTKETLLSFVGAERLREIHLIEAS